MDPEPTPDVGSTQKRRRRRRLIVGSAAVLVLLALLFVGWRGWRAAQAGQRGKTALLEAERMLRAEDFDGARAALAVADREFAGMKSQISGLGPLRVAARQVPFVRVQLRGAETFADAGAMLSSAGLRLADAAQGILRPADERVPLAKALETLRGIGTALDDAERSVALAADKVNALDGYRLLGPLDDARRQLAERLPDARERTRDAAEGVRAFLSFAGADGPSRYLLLSQNPDEVRPTGGFIGTYGVMEANAGELQIARYASIESWTLTHLEAVVPPEQAPNPFHFGELPRVQTLANVNAVADWPTAGHLAADLWAKGGEAPVDGVIGFTPELLAHLLRVLGPVAVPDFNETVTAANVIERIDYYTHGEASENVLDVDRKRFVASAARPVLQALLDAPASRWRDLAKEVSTAFDRRLVMGWSSKPEVQQALTNRSWEGTLPEVRGDFFYNAEFEFAAKNGRGLHRTFEHKVELRPDGSGTVTTTATTANTRELDLRGDINVDAFSYITVYGPEGATLSGRADPVTALEETVRGHPAVAYDRTAKPLGTASYTVAWDVPHLAFEQPDGTWRYDLTWLALPANSADRLHLEVVLPPSWRWQDGPPPSDVRLDVAFAGSWAIRVSS